MSMRTFSLTVLLMALAACKPAPEASPESVEDDSRIACAVDGVDVFSQSCSVERSQQDGTLYLIVRHPDGAFRRFEVLKDGRGIAAADGAAQAEVALTGDMLDVTVGADRYRFPATQADNDE